MRTRWLLLLLLLAARHGEASDGRLSQLMKSLRELEQAGVVQEGEIDGILDADDPKAAAHALLQRMRMPPLVHVRQGETYHPRMTAGVLLRRSISEGLQGTLSSSSRLQATLAYDLSRKRKRGVLARGAVHTAALEDALRALAMHARAPGLLGSHPRL